SSSVADRAATQVVAAGGGAGGWPAGRNAGTGVGPAHGIAGSGPLSGVRPAHARLGAESARAFALPRLRRGPGEATARLKPCPSRASEIATAVQPVKLAARCPQAALSGPWGTAKYLHQRGTRALGFLLAGEKPPARLTA